jgi:hypothetical protein
MAFNVFSEGLALLGRIHRMEAAPVKHEAKWCSVNVAFEDVQSGKRTPDVRFGSFVSGLLYRNLYNINPDNVEFLLRQPDCVVASAASDV